MKRSIFSWHEWYVICFSCLIWLCICSNSTIQTPWGRLGMFCKRKQYFSPIACIIRCPDIFCNHLLLNLSRVTHHIKTYHYGRQQILMTKKKNKKQCSIRPRPSQNQPLHPIQLQPVKEETMYHPHKDTVLCMCDGADGINDCQNDSYQ